MATSKRSKIQLSKTSDALRQHIEARAKRTHEVSPPSQLLAGSRVSGFNAEAPSHPASSVRQLVDQAKARTPSPGGPSFADARQPVQIFGLLGSPLVFGQAIRGRREQLGLSQQALADRAGVGRRFVSELEAGKATMELGKAMQVCRASGLTLAMVDQP